MNREPRPIDWMNSLVLETGQVWGEVALPAQQRDAEAWLSMDGRRFHYATRPRGGSKTTDLAGVNLVSLLWQAPDGSTSHVYARDKDQAALLVRAASQLAIRSGLGPALALDQGQITNVSTGARLVVESADAPSAHGHIPFLVALDEFAQWPSTPSSLALWEAIFSGMDKRSDSRLVIITSAGDPAHLAYRVLEEARESMDWRVSEWAGPSPFMTEHALERQRRFLMPSTFERLHMNRWTGGEDRLVSPEDLRACVRLEGPTEPGNHIYAMGVDVGLTNDRTVVTIVHREGERIMLDRQLVMQGSRIRPVSLSALEERIGELSRLFHYPPIRFDPWQSEMLQERLRRKGLSAHAWRFTSSSVGELSAALFTLLREHRLWLPNHPDLLDELRTVRLRENTQGAIRLDHDPTRHDDRAVSLGLAVMLCQERQLGRAMITIPHGRVVPIGAAGAGNGPKVRLFSHVRAGGNVWRSSGATDRGRR